MFTLIPRLDVRQRYFDREPGGLATPVVSTLMGLAMLGAAALGF
jgi:hypothetical protein